MGSHAKIYGSINDTNHQSRYEHFVNWQALSIKAFKHPATVEKEQKIELNDAQRRAVEAPRGPLLIVAGAGTGKTRTLTSRILFLIEKGINPERICAITFTNKAAEEMKKRVAGEQKPKTREPYIGTFHSLGARMLRRECKLLGREPNFAIYDDHDSFDLIKKAVKEILGQEAKSKEKEKDPKKSPVFFAQKISERKNSIAPAAENIQNEIERDSPMNNFPDPDAGSPAFARNSDEMPRRSERENKIIDAVFNAYESALMKNNAFDFDDLIQKPVMLFQTWPSTLKKWQALFDAVLVDEWQDVNPQQNMLVKLLAGGHRNLSVVGDDEQTIYSWRYADVKMFLNFPKEWTGTKIEFLEENYRSTKTIIEAAGAVVQNNQFRTPKKLWTANPDGQQISLYEAWGENEEAAWIADQIKNQESGTGGKEKSVAILYRTNAQSRAIEQALIRRDIPYRIYGGLKFYERREVKDAVAALRYASNPRDGVSRERLEKFSKKKFFEFENALRYARRDHAPADEDSLRAPAPADILNLFFTTFNYFEYLEENFINADDRMENLEELSRFVADFENLPDLLEKLSLLQATDDENNDKRQATSDKEIPVHLSTIHLAKGLEFDTVFIAGVAEGLLPHGRSLDDKNQLEEERRLMYVAMTRARKKLAVSFYGTASRFVNEIPEQFIALEKSIQTEKSNYGSREWQDDEKYIELD